MLANKNKEAQEDWSDDDNKKYANFRINLRLLRYTTNLSAVDLGKQIGFKKHYRIESLERGKSAIPKLD